MCTVVKGCLYFKYFHILLSHILVCFNEKLFTLDDLDENMVFKIRQNIAFFKANITLKKLK